MRYALLDTGSTNTLITRRLADEIGVKGENVSCGMDTVGANSTWDTEMVSFSVGSVDGAEEFMINNALVVSHIPAVMPCAQIDTSCYPHLTDLPFRIPDRDMHVDILIGMDRPELTMPLEVRSSPENESWPYATRTRLGWVLHGPVGETCKVCAGINFLNITNIEKRVQNLRNLGDDDGLVSESVDDKRVKVSESSSVSFIREHTEVDQWCYVPPASEPVDVVSCEASPVTIGDLRPAFLSLPKSQWPKFETSQDDDSDEKRVVMTLKAEEHPLDVLINHYSSYYRLKKAVAWWIMLIGLLMIGLLMIGLLMSRTHDVVQGSSSLSVGDLHEAEVTLVKHVQRSSYLEELQALLRGRHVSRASSLSPLCPMLSQDLICVGGRLRHSPLDPSACHPVVLPPQHCLTRVILNEYHDRAHLGVEWIASRVRLRFWVPKLRSILRGIRSKCTTCKRKFDRPMTQKMADLPSDRCSPTDGAFNHVGVDLFGPFHVKFGRATVKRYGCVFSCLSTRAIHLEVLTSLETDSFINGFVRFCARRGYPELVRSDNGTNFVGCQSELSREFRRLDKSAVVREARWKEVVWIFNPPYASHQGGAWERMIRIVRRVLTAIVNPNLTLSDEALSTVFCEVEGIVNSRPLIKLSSDTSDLDPLTPNHLLLMRGNASLPWTNASEGELYRRRWKMVQSLSSMFWKRWLREYLPELQRRMKWTQDCPNVKVGDLVLIVDELCPRGMWPLGLVDEVR